MSPSYATHVPYTMGVSAITLTRGASSLSFEAAGSFKITPMVVAGTLRGAGAIRSVQSYIEGAEGEIAIGGWPLAALPIMLGIAAPSPTGSTPNQTTQYNLPASTSLPYFTVTAKGVKDDAQGAIMVRVPSAKITKGFTLEMKDGANYTIPSLAFMAIPDGSSVPFYVYDDETARATSAALPAGTTLTSTAAAATASIMTLTFGSAHGLTAGQWVTVAGCTESYADAVNGLKQIIAAPTTTTITFAAIGAGTDASVSGTITVSY